MDLPLAYKDIIKILPHRYPFLLVDRVIELEAGERIVAIKNVTGNEPFFQGHFPGSPIMPGVLIVEAMAQAGGIMARLSFPDLIEKEGNAGIFFISMDKVKFRRPVVPGDQIVIKAKALRKGSRIWKIAGKSYVSDDLVAEAELTAAIG